MRVMLLLTVATAFAAAGCQGAHLVSAGGSGPSTVTSPTDVPTATRPASPGPLERRFGSLEPGSNRPTTTAGETDPRRVADARLAQITRAVERRRVENQPPRPGPTAGDRANALSDSYAPYNNIDKGVYGQRGVNVDIPRFVDFMSRTFGGKKR